MTRVFRSTVFATLGLLVVQLLCGQVTARQGTRSEEANEFQSPMILEVPFIANTPSVWTGNWMSGKDYVALRKFRCELCS